MTGERSDVYSTFQELVERIAARVRPFCENMPEAEFRALIEQMARIQHKYIHYPLSVPHGLQDDADWPGAHR